MSNILALLEQSSNQIKDKKKYQELVEFATKLQNNYENVKFLHRALVRVGCNGDEVNEENINNTYNFFINLNNIGKVEDKTVLINSNIEVQNDMIDLIEKDELSEEGQRFVGLLPANFDSLENNKKESQEITKKEPIVEYDKNNELVVLCPECLSTHFFEKQYNDYCCFDCGEEFHLFISINELYDLERSVLVGEQISCPLCLSSVEKKYNSFIYECHICQIDLLPIETNSEQD